MIDSYSKFLGRFFWTSELICLLIGLLASQVLIFYFSKSQVSSVQLSVHSLVNREDIGSNAYRISQTLESLESNGTLKCTKLSSKIQGTLFLDTSFKGGCDPSFWNLKGSPFSSTIKSISGNEWIVDSVAVYNGEVQMILWTLRVFLPLSFLGVILWFKARIRQVNYLKDLEIAKREGMLSLSKQVAHDIRSPLMALEAALKNAEGIEPERKNLIEQASLRIKTIAEDLLSKSRGSGGDLIHSSAEPLTCFMNKSFRIGPRIQQIIEEKRLLFPAVSFDANGVDLECLVRGQRDDFDRLFSNLVQNAIDAISKSQDPRVQIAFRKYSTKAQLSVIDNGIGIPQDVYNRIGEEGFSYGKSGGNGLGVSFAKKKMKEWGGQFSIYSQVGCGTLVTLSFGLSKPSEN